jgi:hypothetical protein
VVAFIVRDKSRTYLRNNSNGNGKKQILCEDDKQEKQRQRQKADSCGDDNKKDKGNYVPSPSFQNARPLASEDLEIIAVQSR